MAWVLRFASSDDYVVVLDHEGDKEEVLRAYEEAKASGGTFRLGSSCFASQDVTAVMLDESVSMPEYEKFDSVQERLESLAELSEELHGLIRGLVAGAMSAAGAKAGAAEAAKAAKGFSPPVR